MTSEVVTDNNDEVVAGEPILLAGNDVPGDEPPSLETPEEALEELTLASFSSVPDFLELFPDRAEEVDQSPPVVDELIYAAQPASREYLLS